MTEALVAVAFAESEGEAMVMRSLLEASGVPAIVESAGHGERPSRVPRWDRIVESGKRVMVHAEREAEARAILDGSGVEPDAAY